MYSDNRHFNWTRFFVRFFFGALFGSLVGFRAAADSANNTEFVLSVAGVALAIGLIAGLIGDRFWESFRDSMFNPFRWLLLPVAFSAFCPELSAQNAAAKAATATAAESLKVKKDFKVELVYTVPRSTQGSWINMCLDPRGRLIVSDQHGGLFRVTLPAPGGEPKPVHVEKLNVPLGGAHGLLYAFDSLYVMVSENVSMGGALVRRGLYRAHSADGGETFGKPELLRLMQAQYDKEHGPHALVLAPDGKSIYVAVGNDVKVVSPLAGSLVPKLWGEDRLGYGILSPFHDSPAPAGCIYKIDPDAKDWVLVSSGMRNLFDIAFNRHGEIFGFDNDAQADMNTPWYRPTRIVMAASGGDFGFRNGSNLSPPRYIDTLPAIANVGPGAPTSVTFGYGCKFPAKYQEALIMGDWSYGRLYAAHLTPDGSMYRAQVEDFVSGTPLPVTDMIVHPGDGALYFLIGGRQTQSALYRVTYIGKESTEPSKGDNTGADARALRKRLEAFHGHTDPKAVPTAWPYLGHEDRFIRFAARVAIEHQDPKEWRERALTESNQAAAINALLALVRAVGKDPLHHPRKNMDPIPGAEMKGPIIASLQRIAWDQMTEAQHCDLVRVYTILFSRLGSPEAADRDRLLQSFDAVFPAQSYELNADLCRLLVYLRSPTVAEKSLKLLAAAPSQEEQMEYARLLRVLATGWTLEQRQQYFAWFAKAANYQGGQRLQQSIWDIKQDALTTLSAEEKKTLAPFLQTTATSAGPLAKPRPVVKKWTLAELTPLVEKGLTRRDFERGRRLFGEAKCFACHHFDKEGGAIGPELTFAAGRFNVRDLLESIIEPNKVISDQYVATVFTLTSGKIVTGRIVNLRGDNYSVMTDMLAPFSLTTVSIKTIESKAPSPVSPMPTGLLDTFQEDEILDLVAYLLSRGERKDRMFQN